MYAKYSPGTYLLTHVMEDLCRDGVAAIDFGIGEALYKQRFGRATWQETEVYLYAPTWRGMRVKAIRAARCRHQQGWQAGARTRPRC